MARARDLLIFSLAVVPLWSNEAAASGFALREFSLDATASAFAGASAGTQTPGYQAYNPAAAAGVSSWDAQLTLNGILPTSRAAFSLAETSAGTPVSGDSTPDGFSKAALEPGAALRLRLSGRWSAGLSISAPWGLSTIYDRTWAGRYYAVETTLLSANIAPDLAWEVTDKLTVGAGLQVQYATGTLSNAIDFGTLGASIGLPGALPGQQDGFVTFKASDWAVGHRLGLIWKPRDGLVIGAAWRSGLSQKLKGKIDFSLDGSGVGATLAGATGAFIDTKASTRLDFPAVTSLGIEWKVDERLTLLGEFAHTDWDSFRELRVVFANPAQPDSYQTYDWKDSWLAAAGARLALRDDLVLRAGIALDETPARDATRDPRIPDASRTWLAAGIDWRIGERTWVQASYARLMLPPERIDLSATTPGNELRGNLAGVTETDADVISVQVSLR